MPSDETTPRLAPRLISFDVFGTLISVRESSYGAFGRILAAADASHVDVRAFWEHWEERNIALYWGPYRPYRAICAQSLAETFAHFGIAGDPGLIGFYFDAFPSFFLYDDVLPTLERLSSKARLAVVSNIDDDLLAATPLPRYFDLVCTAERARGYKPDGTLFRYLLDRRRNAQSRRNIRLVHRFDHAAFGDDRVDQPAWDCAGRAGAATGLRADRYCRAAGSGRVSHRGARGYSADWTPAVPR